MTDVMTLEETQHQHAPSAPSPAPVVSAKDPMVAMIQRVVMDPTVDIAKLEKMLEVKERLDAQSARKSFGQAIAGAKAKIGPIEKTGRVSYGEGQKKTDFRHETLDGIARMIDPVLSAHGLSYRYRSKQEDGMVIVTCIIEHIDGHHEETTLMGSPDTSGSKNAYQAVGSAATYLQRYTLKLALGLSAAKDDDAKGASPDAQEPPSTISEAQYKELRGLIDEAGITEEVVCTAEKIEHLPGLPSAKFDHVAGQLKVTIKKMAGAQ